MIFGPRLTNCWLTAATWVVEALIKTGIVDISLAVDVRRFNYATTKSPVFGHFIERFDVTNLTGFFRIRYRHQCFYFLTEGGRQVEFPYPIDKAWLERVTESGLRALTIPSTRGRPRRVDNTGDGAQTTTIVPMELSESSRRHTCKHTY
jgi:hypothetical protein